MTIELGGIVLEASSPRPSPPEEEREKIPALIVETALIQWQWGDTLTPETRHTSHKVCFSWDFVR